MTDSVEYMFRDALRHYSSEEKVKTAFAVCWYAYLSGEIEYEKTVKLIDGDRCIYRIMAENRTEAVKVFLLKKAGEAYGRSLPDYKGKCIRMIVECMYKYGKMRCLDNSTFRDFSIDVETVIDGGYYSVDEIKDDEDDARTEGIIKSVDTDLIVECITPQLFSEVFVESHLYDVAVMELTNIEKEEWSKTNIEEKC